MSEKNVLTEEMFDNFIENFDYSPIRPDIHEIGFYSWQLELIEKEGQKTGKCPLCLKKTEDCEYWTGDKLNKGSD